MPRLLTAAPAVLALQCPKCKAVPGKQCTYVLPQDVAQRRTALQHLSANTQAVAARAGKPMRRSHNERYALAYRQGQRASQFRERERLRSWLARFGDLFQQ